MPEDIAAEAREQPMRVITCKNYDEMSARAAEFVAAQITLKPDSVLGLPTGSTPIGMYERLTAMNLDFSEVTTFNLDEYYPISRTNNQSYYYFMNEHLYSKVNLKPENIYIPNGETDDPKAECKRYEQEIKLHGGLDMQVLGIGQNGHIGFNEPSDALNAFTHVTGLTQSTIEANARFFESKEDVPTRALTMGVSTIMHARRILLLASGKEKAKVVNALLGSFIDPEIPATILSAHLDVTVIADEAAING